MGDRKSFVEKIAPIGLTRVEQAIALLWFYRQSQEYEERSASELAEDLADENLGRPNVTQLHKDLMKSKMTVKGRRAKTFQIHAKHLPVLNNKYGEYLDNRPIVVTSSVIPNELFQGTKPHFEKIVAEINGSYDSRFYDGCAVLMRRLLESLIVEVFISKKLVSEIRFNNAFMMLDALIGKVVSNPNIILGRNTHRSMLDIKKIGDTAGHDRSYITQKIDIDDIKLDTRRTFQELLTLCGLTK